MITTQEPITQKGIFCSIRQLVQELHADKVILEDVHGTPFLFKSQDAQVWVRVFYRSMRDFSIETLKREIQKLWVLMPRDAVLYLFYPELDREQIFKMNGINDRLSFFEYGHLAGIDKNRTDIRICKWIPAMSIMPKILKQQPDSSCPQNKIGGFFQESRLTSKEIAGLSELALALKRF